MFTDFLKVALVICCSVTSAIMIDEGIKKLANPEPMWIAIHAEKTVPFCMIGIGAGIMVIMFIFLFRGIFHR